MMNFQVNEMGYNNCQQIKNKYCTSFVLLARAQTLIQASRCISFCCAGVRRSQNDEH